MSTKTRAELINEVLEVLRVLQAGEEADAVDYDSVDARIDTAVDQLSAKSVISIGQTDHFDGEIFDPLAKWIANSIAGKWGGKTDLQVEMAVEGDMRRITAAKPTYETMTAVYF